LKKRQTGKKNKEALKKRPAEKMESFCKKRQTGNKNKESLKKRPAEKVESL